MPGCLVIFWVYTRVAVTSNRRAGSVAVLTTSYLAGAIPFAQIVARFTSTIDLRDHGVGTVSASGLKDVAGVGSVIVAGVLDVAKGTIGPLLAGAQQRPTLATIASAVAVTGHNWSPFLRGAGGRGISPAMGALLVVAPEGAAVLLAGVAAGRALGETALGALAAYAALAPALARTRGHAGRVTATAVLAPIVIKRLAGNRRATAPRTYLWRLLLDRDQCDKS
jgi:acyl phosphate:glycerol-3-phosphate acyltransferase